MSIASVLTAIFSFLNSEFLGVATSFIMLIAFLTVIDLFTGIIAARNEGSKIESGKLSLTAIKFVMLFVWIVLAYHVNELLGQNSIIIGITTIPLVLIALREFISIGENIEKRFKTKPYIFELIEKMFDVIELKFLKK